MIEARRIIQEAVPYEIQSISRKDKIRMDLNENGRGCSVKVLEAIRRMSVFDIATYPEYRNLERKIASCHRIDPRSVMLTNGGDDAIRCIMEAYVDKGDRVVIPSPTFPMFKILARLRGARLEEVLYEKDLSFPTADILKSADKNPRMMVVVNPGSPTGTSLSGGDLKKILEKAENSIVLLDETYHHFAGKTYVRLTEKYENLITIQSFSKAFGLAGLRLGFAASHKKNMDHLKKTNLPFCVNSAAVVGGEAALDDRKHLRNVIAKTNREKKFLCEKLGELGIDVRTTDTNFLLMNFGKSCRAFCEELERRGILVKCMDDYPLLEGYVRMSVSSRKENVKLLEALRAMRIPGCTTRNMKTLWRH